MDWILAISITINLVLVIILLFRNEESTAQRQALKGIADLGTNPADGLYVDRGEVVRMALEALAGHEKSVMQRFNDWRERRKAKRQEDRAAREAEEAAKLPPAPGYTPSMEAIPAPPSGAPSTSDTKTKLPPYNCLHCGRLVQADEYHDCRTTGVVAESAPAASDSSAAPEPAATDPPDQNAG